MGDYKRRWDGSGDYVRANAAALGLARNKNAVTFAFWTKDYPSSSGDDVIFQVHMGSTSTSSSWFKAEITTANFIRITARRLWADSDTTVTSSGTNMRDGNWHRVALVFDFATPLFSIFVDGVLNASTATGLTAGASEDLDSARFDLGYTTSACVRAYIFNFQVWDIAFSAEHALWDYAFPLGIATEAHNSPLGSRKNNLLIWYKLDEESGAVIDYSWNGYLPSYSGVSVANPVADPAPPAFAWLSVEIPPPVLAATVPFDNTADIDVVIPPPTVLADCDVDEIFCDAAVDVPPPVLAAVAVVSTFASLSVLVPPPKAAATVPFANSADLAVEIPSPMADVRVGINSRTVDRSGILTPHPETTALAVIFGDDSISRMVILRSKYDGVQQGILECMSRFRGARSAVLRCGVSRDETASAILSGRHDTETSGILRAKTRTGSFALLRCDDGSQPIVELDQLKLRSSSIYPEPASLFTLPWVYGDWSSQGVSVPVQCVDRTENIWLIADHPILELVEVLQDGVPMTAGWEFRNAHRDPTGRQVSVLKLFTAVGGALEARVKGRAFLSGTLIENPADIVVDVLENLQGYSYEFINRAAMGSYRASCSKDNLKFRIHLAKESSVKALVAQIALNTNAVHVVDKGQHGLRRREGFL